MNSEDQLSLERRNKACFANRYLDDTKHSLSLIKKELSSLQAGQTHALAFKALLERYIASLEADKELSWFPLLELLLESLKATSAIKEDDVRMNVEGGLIGYFLKEVER